ncbi:MAG: translation elongation factor Ts [Gammaproteobacteria bacterium]|nr:translation elongation factor Ts [Gammaproteobacteria bacterium]
MSVTAAQVKELRDLTDAPMMDCKKALEATSGDIKLAVEELRKKGRAKADKKADRIAAEGAILIQSADANAIMLEINSETDFVARDENFLAFVNKVATTALNAKQILDVEALASLPMSGQATTIDEERRALIAKVGENINIRRLVRTKHNAPTLGTYLHGNRIGVIVEMEGGNTDLARDIAMHIAASKPIVVAANDVSADLIAKEKEIYTAQAAGSGKPQEIIEKMVAGRLKKFLDEVSLLGQPFVKDPDVTVGALLERNHAKVLGFTRFEVGEGIEKQEEDFVEAVMAQAQGAR